MSLFDGKPMPQRGLGPDNALQTPPDLYASLDAVFGPFDLDVCASDENHLAPMYFTEDASCLQAEWGPTFYTKGKKTLERPNRAYLNPPFSEDLNPGDIVKKAFEEALAGRCSTLVCIPGYKREFDWWADYVVGAQGHGATGIIDASGPKGNRRIDFWRNGSPVGSPNQRITFIWYQAGLVSAEARWHYRLPWTGTLWLPGYQLRLPRIAIDGILNVRGINGVA